MKKLLLIIVALAGSLAAQTTSVGNTVNIGNAGPVAKDSTLTSGSAKSVVRGAAKGSTAAADVTSTASGTNHQAIDAILYDALGNVLGVLGSPLRVDPTGTTTQPVSVQNWPSTQPVSGTVNVGNLPATQPVSAASLPLPAGAATSAKQPALGTAGAPSPDVITVQGKSGMTPVVVDGSATTQPVSAASLPLPAGAAQDSTLTGGSAKAIARGGQKGTTSSNSDITHTASGANHEGLDVALYDGSGNQLGLPASPLRVDPTGTTTQPVSCTSATCTVQLVSGQQIKITDGTNVLGVKSENAGAPGATNLGTLPAIANAAPPSKTEGNQGALSMDLKGNLRVNNHPPDVLGCYQVNMRTSTYSGLASGTPLLSVRWGDATHLMVLNHVRVNVITTVAATTAGQAEREIIIARSFTASDSGGTAVTLAGNNQKMRTSFGTSLVTDMRVGTTITAGTRTLDANPVASAIAWLPLNMTGVDIGCSGAAATGAVWSCVSSAGYIDLVNAGNGNDYPIVLAQNEGIIGRIGKDTMPAGATQQTYWQLGWCEVNAY